MSNISRFSLWLVPEIDSEIHRLLAGYIAAMAKEHQTPDFVPHVTLFSAVEGEEGDICSKIQKVAEIMAPYEIQLGKVGSNGSYFQILFTRVEQTEAVMHANTVVQNIFGVKHQIYFPHLSLAYGDFSPEELGVMEDQLLKQIGSVTGKSFFVREIELWRTEGKVSAWHKVAAFSLNLQSAEVK